MAATRAMQNNTPDLRDLGVFSNPKRDLGVFSNPKPYTQGLHRALDCRFGM